MTPYAQKVFRKTAHLIGGPSGNLPEALAQASCFDIDGIIPTAYEAGDDLARNPTLINGEAHYDHGGLLFMPAPIVWLEFVAPLSGVRVGLLLNEADEEIGVNIISPNIPEQHAAFMDRRDGDLFLIRPQAKLHGIQNEKIACEGATIAALALMVINAPRGVLRQLLPLHKGLLREVRRAGFGPMRPSHKIVLDINAGDIGGASGSGPSSEKAFHYCRSHIRRITPDRSIVVRGHWKGNPALGIARGDYVLRGDTAGTIH
jgi:hypothetical protein